jgi:uncharacterized protein (TIGR02466 family)
MDVHTGHHQSTWIYLIKMKMNELGIMDLHPRPLGITKLPSFDKESLVAFADTLEYRDSMRGEYDGWISVDYQILNGSDFVNVKKQILAYALAFGRDVLGHLFDDLHISCSWMTKLDKGQSAQSHSHTNCYMAGVLYLTEGSPIIFSDFNLPSYIEPEIAKKTEYNRNGYPIKATPGKLILFPSSLVHGVETSSDSHSRYSLAFNIVPVGEMGYPTSFLQLPSPE